MDARVGRKLEMAARVREFSRAHPSDDSGYGIVVNRFEDRLNRAEVLAARQDEGWHAARSARSHRSELRRELHFQLLRYLVAVGGAAARTRAELAQQFRLPSTKSSTLSFVTAVKGLLTRAEAQRGLLLSEGMSPALLDDMRAMVSDLEKSSETARTARRGHMGARGDLKLITAELMELVGVLDGVNRYRFRKDPETMVEWKAVHVVPFQSKGATPAPAVNNGVVPPSTGGSTSGG